MNERNEWNGSRRKNESRSDCGCGERCECRVNPSIECTVEHCAYHCKTDPYCSLDRIRISSAESSPESCSKVDCKSFCPGR